MELVEGKSQREEVQNAEVSAPKRSGGPGIKATDRALPSSQNEALPHRAVPEMDEERGHGGVLVVPVQDTDTGAPV